MRGRARKGSALFRLELRPGTRLNPAPPPRWLRDFPPPGNLRELRNVFESAVLLTRSTRLSVDDLPEEIKTSTNRENSFTVYLGSPLDEIEQEYIRHTIAFADGNKARASEILRVPRRTLYGKLKRYNTRHESNGRSNGNQYRGPRNGIT